MRKIIYYVASSLDGFISGPDDDISGFVSEGNGIDRYLSDLADFDTVIMGRNTYEFGYKFGLKPGQPAYPHMTHYIFSGSLILDNPHPKIQVKNVDLESITDIRNRPGSDIYLCGGGEFAGWLLDNEQIDLLTLKLNPLVLGKGIPLFGSSQKSVQLHIIDSKTYDHGLQIINYEIEY